MTCNVGGVERPIRIIVGLALLVIATFAALPMGWMIAFYVIGGVALMTGAIGFARHGASCASIHAGSRQRGRRRLKGSYISHSGDSPGCRRGYGTCGDYRRLDWRIARSL